MHNPTVSVIIPTYNRENVISRAIDSILEQTYTDYEVLIVDDGSTYRTREVIERKQKDNDCIQYFSQENSGAAVARNHGIQEANGEYIAFLDSDDQWLPEKLESQLRLFEESYGSNLGFVGANKIILRCDDQDNVVNEENFYENQFVRNEEFTLEDFLSLKNPVSPTTALVSKKALKEVGTFDPQCPPHEDFELWIRLSEQYDFDTTWTPLAKYRDWGEGISKTTGSSKKARVKKYIMNKHSDLYNKYPKPRSIMLRKIGTELMLAGKQLKAIQYFCRSIKQKPDYFRNYLNLFASCMGSSVYRYLLRMYKNSAW